MNPNDTHQRWHPHEDEAYLRAAIARVNGGDMERDYQADYEHLADQTRRLAEVLMHEFPEAFKGTNGSEGCVDMAIRVLREQKATLTAAGVTTGEGA